MGTRGRYAVRDVSDRKLQAELIRCSVYELHAPEFINGKSHRPKSTFKSILFGEGI